MFITAPILQCNYYVNQDIYTAVYCGAMYPPSKHCIGYWFKTPPSEYRSKVPCILYQIGSKTTTNKPTVCIHLVHASPLRGKDDFNQGLGILVRVGEKIVVMVQWQF